MDKKLEEILSEYDYTFDPSLIATEPAEPRDSAKLLVYRKETGEEFYDTFANIGEYLPKNAVLVLNDTKVFPARLHVKRKTGGRMEVFYVGVEGENILALTNHFLEVGEKVFLNDEIYFKCLSKNEKIYTLKPSFLISDVQKVFLEFGETPIPPYIKNSKLSEGELREKYQTVFAKNTGSVAAPTASLHFTEALLEKLKKQGIDIEFVTLHVNLGTFAPLTQEALDSGKLHTEWYEISDQTSENLLKAKKEGRSIIAVGTTAVRTLETSRGKAGRGETRLFIQEGDTFHFVDGMITNFHVPKSSLIMLVSAFVGRVKLFDLYQKAMKKGFQLFSFGDGMLLY